MKSNINGKYEKREALQSFITRYERQVIGRRCVSGSIWYMNLAKPQITPLKPYQKCEQTGYHIRSIICHPSNPNDAIRSPDIIQFPNDQIWYVHKMDYADILWKKNIRNWDYIRFACQLYFDEFH